MNYGMQIKVVIRNELHIFNNVTEVHWNYAPNRDLKMVAFESDVHGTGCTFPCEVVGEMEITPMDKEELRFEEL